MKQALYRILRRDAHVLLFPGRRGEDLFPAGPAFADPAAVAPAAP